MAKQKQFVRKCIFCGADGVSKEHFWPQWMHPLLPAGEKFTVGFDRFKDGEWESERLREMQGPPMNKTIQCVCEPCNNGWMSEMEKEVRPVLERLMRMETFTITDEERAALVRYFVMKAMVADRNVSETAVFTETQNRAFYLGRSIPSKIRLGIGRYAFDPDVVQQFNKGTLNLTGRDETGKLVEQHTQIAIFTFRIGELFVYMSVSKIALATKPNTQKLVWLSDQAKQVMNWPPANALTTAEALRLQYELQTKQPGENARLEAYIADLAKGVGTDAPPST